MLFFLVKWNKSVWVPWEAESKQVIQLQTIYLEGDLRKHHQGREVMRKRWERGSNKEFIQQVSLWIQGQIPAASVEGACRGVLLRGEGLED